MVYFRFSNFIWQTRGSFLW